MSPLPLTVPLEVLEANPHSCYLLEEDLSISYCNPAWDRFALANGGENVLAAHVLNKPLLSFISPVLRGYYFDLFAQARKKETVHNQAYECSSPQLFRAYHMQIYPLQSGFAIVNSLQVESSHSRQSVAPLEKIYRQSTGFLRMCANCRRTCRPDDTSQWDWVPEFLALKGDNISHGICPVCIEYFYPLT